MVFMMDLLKNEILCLRKQLKEKEDEIQRLSIEQVHNHLNLLFSFCYHCYFQD